MSHVAKSMWPIAFQEGKRVADAVIAANREKKAYRKVDPAKDLPTDRELALAAALNIFWDYKLGQEAAAAARQFTMKSCIAYFEAQSGVPGVHQLTARRNLKALRKILNRTEGDGFLEMWLRVETWLAAAQKPEYWKQFSEDPSTIVRALVSDLERAATEGEEANGQNQQEEPGSEAGAEGAQGAEGGSAEAERAAMPRADHDGVEPEQGKDGPAEAVRGGGEGVEEAPRRIQERNQGEAGPGGQIAGRGESQGGD